MLDANMLNIASALALAAVLGAAYGFAWELRKRRTLPPIRVERATRPIWYWSCIVTHAVLLACIALVSGALSLAIFFNDFFN